MDYIITIDDTLAQRVEQGIANQYNYQPTILDDQGNTVPNPQTTADFLVQIVKKFIADSVTANETQIAVQKAINTTQTNALTKDFKPVPAQQVDPILAISPVVIG